MVFCQEKAKKERRSVRGSSVRRGANQGGAGDSRVMDAHGERGESEPGEDLHEWMSHQIVEDPGMSDPAHPCSFKRGRLEKEECFDRVRSTRNAALRCFVDRNRSVGGECLEIDSNDRFQPNERRVRLYEHRTTRPRRAHRSVLAD